MNKKKKREDQAIHNMEEPSVYHSTVQEKMITSSKPR